MIRFDNVTDRRTKRRVSLLDFDGYGLDSSPLLYNYEKTR
jgi:hypothetical protein